MKYNVKGRKHLGRLRTRLWGQDNSSHGPEGKENKWTNFMVPVLNSVFSASTALQL